jgi:hypothetical protein
MKKLLILIILLTSVLTMKAQDEAFEKLADTKGVEVVYISKSMFNMISDMQMDVNGLNVGKMAGKLNSITILSSETNDAVKIIQSEMKKILKSGRYEQMMYTKDDDSKTVFYTKKYGGKKEDASELLMVSDEESEISVIRIVGNITSKDIQAITKKK